MANLCFILILNLILNFYFYFFFNLVCVLGGECCEGCTVGGGRVLLCDCNCDVNCFQRLFRLFSLFSFSLSLLGAKKKKSCNETDSDYFFGLCIFVLFPKFIALAL